MLLNAEVYDAFLAAGVDEPKARRAAESVTEFPRQQPIEAALERVDTRLAALERIVARLEWAAGTIVLLTLAILVKLFVG